MNINKRKFSPLVVLCSSTAALLIFGILACNAPTAAVTQATPGLAPLSALPTSTLPAQAANPGPPAVEQTAPVSFNLDVVGIWRAKVVGKEVIVFEFKADGKTVWHYTYANGKKKDSQGTYKIKDNILTVDISSAQELTASIQADKMTLTGPDQVTLILQKIDRLTAPSPTTSKNIAQDIIGKWQDVRTAEWITFNSDGTLSITSKENDLKGRFKINANQMEMILNNQAQTSTFTAEIDNNVLTLIAKDGSFVDYIK